MSGYLARLHAMGYGYGKVSGSLTLPVSENPDCLQNYGLSYSRRHRTGSSKFRKATQFILLALASACLVELACFSASLRQYRTMIPTKPAPISEHPDPPGWAVSVYDMENTTKCSRPGTRMQQIGFVLVECSPFVTFVRPAAFDWSNSGAEFQLCLFDSVACDGNSTAVYVKNANCLDVDDAVAYRVGFADTDGETHSSLP